MDVITYLWDLGRIINVIKKIELPFFCRPAQVFVIGTVSWNQLHMMITKSTTPDLIKMAARCDEYYRQQMNSSKRVFGASESRSDHTSSQSNGESASTSVFMM